MIEYDSFFSFHEFRTPDGSGGIIIVVNCDGQIRKEYLIRLSRKNGATMEKALDSGNRRGPPVKN